jgi:hypothetical protein
MAFFFKDPIFSRLEDYLLKQAKERYIKEGRDVGDDVRMLKRTISETLKQEKKELGAVRKQLKWDKYNFKTVIKDAVDQAFVAAILESDSHWYATEKSYDPQVIAAPKLVLLEKTRQRVPDILCKRIQLQNLHPATIESIADTAVETYFGEILEDAITDLRDLKIGPAYRASHMIAVDVIKNDFYRHDKEEGVMRMDIVILSNFDHNMDDRTEHKNRKKARQRWLKTIKSVPGGRPDSRHFQTQPWQLSPETVSQLRRLEP